MFAHVKIQPLSLHTCMALTNFDMVCHLQLPGQMDPELSSINPLLLPQLASITKSKQPNLDPHTNNESSE